VSFRIELATAGDDADLCTLFREVGMDDSGPYRLGFARDPSFFTGLEVEGGFAQTCVCRVAGEQEVAASFSRTTRPLMVNGAAQEIGYLGGLRIRPRHRQGTLLARGFRKLRQLHEDGRCPYYLSAILEGNQEAIAVLTSARAGLPRYHDIGRYVCSSIVTRRRRQSRTSASVERGCAANLDEIVDCLQRNGPRRQFTPCWRREDFEPGTPLTRGFAVSDFYALRRDGRVVAALGAWDQSAYKRTTVEGYSPAMRVARLLWNGLATWWGYTRLPAVGEALGICCVSFVAVDDDDPGSFRALLEAVAADRAEAGDLLCVVGLHERDPLLPVAARMSQFKYSSRLYTVCWEDGESARAQLDGRVPFLEVALL